MTTAALHAPVPCGVTPSLSAQLRSACTEFAGHVAVEQGTLRLTYADLERRALHLAQRISALSRGTPATVAITGERSPGTIVAMAAVIASGSRLLLIDPRLPAARRRHMVERARPDVAVTMGHGHAVEAGIPHLALSEAGHIDGEAPSAADMRSTSDTTGSATTDRGYVFFTSGTTGEPKAVLGRWDSLAHFVSWQRDTFALAPGDRFAQLTGLSFDVVMREIFTPLVSGATVCQPPSGAPAGELATLRWMTECAVTDVHTVPSLSASWLRRDSEETLPALRRLWFAGEPLFGELVQRWRARAPHARVINLYGPTETTLAKFWYEVPSPAPEGQIAVGHPLPGAQLVFLDEYGSPAPEGEVAVRTPFRSAGYLNDPGTTRDRFIPNPLRPDAAEDLLYRTGDLGRLDETGLLHLRGRQDHQVKIDGVRVEPEGVAALLAGHPDIEHAVVVPRETVSGRRYLAGFCVASTGGTPPDAEELQGWLRGRTDNAHVPSVLRLLDSLPLNANGKVDRGALPDPRADEAPHTEDAADSPLTAAVTAEFATVFEEDAFPANGDFFAHGGTSLTAAELAARLSRVTGRDVTFSDVFTARTPRAVTAAVEARAEVGACPAPRRTEQLSTTGLSPQQRRYHRVYLPRTNRSWCNMPLIIDLPDGTSAEQISSALAAVVARHDSLRASFERDGDTLMQHFTDAAPPPVAERLLNAPSRQEEAAESARLLADAAAEPIDIGQWPLFRTSLLTGRSGSSRLLWNVHHMVSDGYSQGVLRAEVLEVLRAARAGEKPALAELPISYRDYISWRSANDGELLAPQRQHWAAVFSEPFERPLLPALGGARAQADGHAFQVALGPVRTGALDAYGREHGATAFSLVFTAYLLGVHELYQRDDMLVGTPAGGRNRPEVAGLIGNFISLVTIRHRLGEAASFAELVDIVQTRVAAAMTHQDVQYDEVMDVAGAELDDDRFPLTSAFISLVEVPDAAVNSLKTSGHRALGSEVKFDVMAYLRKGGGHLALDVLYRGGLLSEEAAQSFTERVLEILDAGLSEPSAQVSALGAVTSPATATR